MKNFIHLFIRNFKLFFLIHTIFYFQKSYAQNLRAGLENSIYGASFHTAYLHKFKNTNSSWIIGNKVLLEGYWLRFPAEFAKNDYIFYQKPNHELLQLFLGYQYKILNKKNYYLQLETRICPSFLSFLNYKTYKDSIETVTIQYGILDTIKVWSSQIIDFKRFNNLFVIEHQMGLNLNFQFNKRLRWINFMGIAYSLGDFDFQAYANTPKPSDFVQNASFFKGGKLFYHKMSFCTFTGLEFNFQEIFRKKEYENF